MPFGFRFEREALARFIREVSFPADRRAIIELAEKKGVPSTVVSMLQGLPDRTFASADDVSKDLAPSKAA